MRTLSKIVNNIIEGCLFLTLGTFIVLSALWCLGGQYERAAGLALPSLLNLVAIYLWRFLVALETAATKLKDSGE